MNSDLDQALRSSVEHLTLDVPAADVLSRGDQLRHRRRRGVLVGATGVVVAAVLGAVALSGQQPSRDLAGTERADGAPALRVGSWSGSSTNLSTAELVEVREACAAAVGDHSDLEGSARPGWTLPVVAERRGDVVLTYFRHGGGFSTCALQSTSAGGFRVTAQTADLEETLPSDRHVAFVTAGTTGSVIDAVVRTSPDVARVDIAVAGHTYVSATGSGLAFFWLPDDEATRAGLGQATVTARDADGVVVERLAHGWPEAAPRPGPTRSGGHPSAVSPSGTSGGVEPEPRPSAGAPRSAADPAAG